MTDTLGVLLIFKTLHSLISLLNSEKSPSQIAAAIAMGMLAGFTPLIALHQIAVFAVVFLFRVNLSMFFTSFAVFSILAFALDPAFDAFGYFLLVDVSAARPLWLYFAASDYWPFFGFNNTVMVGSIVLSLILWIPIFVLAIVAIRRYRQHWRAQLQSSKFVKALKATPFYDGYQKIQAVYDKWGALS